MIQFVYVYSRLEKRLERILERNETGYELNAARKVIRIRDALLSGRDMCTAGNLNDNGEARIKNGVKYDLGKGFRLVCLRSGDSVFLTYMGNHDSSNAWLGRSRNLKIIEDLDRFMRFRVVREDDGDAHTSESSHGFSGDRSMDDDYDDYLMKHISDRDLRRVFQGIVNTA
ncbi:MAG: hypothetical protein V1793_24040 [Pseudomonadota bacterium]